MQLGKKKGKGIQIEKEEINLSLFTDNKIFYADIENKLVVTSEEREGHYRNRGLRGTNYYV